MLAAGREADRLLPGLAQLGEPARGAQPDLDRVTFKIAVLRLSRVGGHGDRPVADVLDLVDRSRFGDGATGGVVSRERGGFGGARRADRVRPLAPASSRRWVGRARSTA